MATPNNYKAICALYDRAKEAYFIDNTRIISDDAYDKLESQIAAEIEKGADKPRHWDVLEPLPKSGKVKVPHWAPVQKVKKVSLEQFKKLGIENPVFSPKMDGVSIYLKYEFGILTAAITRGDGKFGIDVLDNVRHVKGIPSILENPQFTEQALLPIQGEVFIPKGHGVTNKRNKASAALLYWNPKIHNDLPLYFCAHNTYHMTNEVIKKDEYGEIYAGVELSQVNLDDGMKDFLDFRDSVNVELDGVVCLHEFQLLAIKFPPDYAVSKLEKITYSKGPKGKKTPVGHVTPVVIKERKIKKVNLYNKNYVDRHGIKEGKNVKIILSGDTIPVIDEVFEE